MNYLAHILLSGKEEAVRIGGFIADSVKGSRYNQYPDAIRFGILMHRKIDTYTDRHEVVHRSIKRLRPVYGKFSGVVVDMVYDHFLAAKWGMYNSQPLKEFTQEFYDSLEGYIDFLSERFKKYMPIFVGEDRLGCYADLECFEYVLQKMGEHTSLPNESAKAMKLIRSQYDNLGKDFCVFFPELQSYSNRLMKFRNSEPSELLGYSISDNKVHDDDLK